MTDAPSQLYHLAHFEEALGTLRELEKDQDILVAQISQIRIALPNSLEQELRPLVGCRLAILRTDIASKPYLFRILDPKPSDSINEISDSGDRYENR